MNDELKSLYLSFRVQRSDFIVSSLCLCGENNYFRHALNSR